MRPAQRQGNQVDQEIGACGGSISVMIAHQNERHNKNQRDQEMPEPVAYYKLFQRRRSVDTHGCKIIQNSEIQ